MATEILTQRPDADEAAVFALPTAQLMKEAIDEAHALSNGVGRAWTLAGIVIEKVTTGDTDSIEAEALTFALQAGLHADDARALKLTYLVDALVKRLAETEASHG